jgi:hypothetical protein
MYPERPMPEPLTSAATTIVDMLSSTRRRGVRRA